MRKQPIRCGAAISTVGKTSDAIDQVCRAALEQLGDQTPHVAMLFSTVHHREDLSAAVKSIREQTNASVLIGCTGESILAGAKEIEGQPAIALWLAALPDVQVVPMHLEFERTPDGGTFIGWPDQLFGDWPQGASLLMLGDPFSFPADALLERVNEEHPGVPVFGGMASGAASPGETRLILNEEIFDSGAVALLLHGAVRIRSVTSQGCRPIGTHYVITKAHQNVIQELGGESALSRLKNLFNELPAADQQLVNTALHVGRVLSEYQDHFEQGDFLIKNVIGVDPEAGAIAVGDYVRVGQTVQFHVRDEASADTDLAALLASAKDAAGQRPAGALLFTCNGRGTRLFSQPDHDAAKVQEVFPNLPLAGFFAAGEIGPVGGKNYIHGFTASVALFEEAPE